jgi:hypothetical protein
METLFVVGLWCGLLWEAPRFFGTVYLPGYLAGLGLCYFHGYFEHARGTVSHYGLLYNLPFFNDGYHVEHHQCPAEHWTRLPNHAQPGTKNSRWPAVLRWLEIFNLEVLERIALRSRAIQRVLLRTHERAFVQLLPQFRDTKVVKIVGGGMFPRTAILLRRLLPDSEITVLDASARSIETGKAFLGGAVGVTFTQEVFDAKRQVEADLVVIPLSFIGDRAALYRRPPAPAVLVHDWVWRRRGESVVVSPWLLKRMNLIRQ